MGAKISAEIAGEYRMADLGARVGCPTLLGLQAGLFMIGSGEGKERRWEPRGGD